MNPGISDIGIFVLGGMCGAVAGLVAILLIIRSTEEQGDIEPEGDD